MTRRAPHGENRLSDTSRDWQLLAVLYRSCLDESCWSNTVHMTGQVEYKWGQARAITQL